MIVVPRRRPGHFGRIVLPHPVINPLFVSLLVSVLQSICVNCHRLRLSPHYVNLVVAPRCRLLARLKTVSALCLRQPQLSTKQLRWPKSAVDSLTVSSAMRRPSSSNSREFVSPPAPGSDCTVTTRSRTGTADWGSLEHRTGGGARGIHFCCLGTAAGIGSARPRLHQRNESPLQCDHVHAPVLVSFRERSQSPVLPPVARPAMRTMNLKTGNPFVIEPTGRNVPPRATRYHYNRIPKHSHRNQRIPQFLRPTAIVAKVYGNAQTSPFVLLLVGSDVTRCH